MFNLIILLIIECLLILYAWRRFKGDFFSPFIFTTITMILATSLCILSQKRWRMELQTETLFVISAGLLGMLIGSVRFSHSYRRTHNILSSDATLYIIKPKFQIMIALLSILCTYFYYKEMLSLIIMYSVSDEASLGDAKEMLISEEYAINPIIKQFYKLVLALALISFLILCNNLIYKMKFRENMLYIIPISCGGLISIAAGNRIEVFKIIIAYFFIFSILWRRKNSWKPLPIQLIIKYGLPIGIIFISAFVMLRIITKPSIGEAQSSGDDSLNYVCFYIGSPIQVLNVYIKEGIQKWEYPDLWGRTFHSINVFLSNCNFMKETQQPRSSFVYIGGNSDIHGNAATFFSAPYIDYGIIGLFFICFITYHLFDRYYTTNILHRTNSIKNNRKLLLYAYCYSSVISLAFYDTNLKGILSQTGVLQLLVLWIVYSIMFRFLVTRKHFNH